MRSLGISVLLSALVMQPAVSYSQSPCVAPALSDAQVKNVIDKERATRTDLPAPFAESRWSVRRQGCHYVFMETSVPEVLDGGRIFKLNQHGVIVDVQIGNSNVSTLKCPERTFSESELADIVKDARGKSRDLPPPFPNHRIRVDRVRCLYLYFEYAIPERRGDFQVFTIDPLGELMDVFRSQPY
jgi:hypothetical protein